MGLKNFVVRKPNKQRKDPLEEHHLLSDRIFCSRQQDMKSLVDQSWQREENIEYEKLRFWPPHLHLIPPSLKEFINLRDWKWSRQECFFNLHNPIIFCSHFSNDSCYVYFSALLLEEIINFILHPDFRYKCQEIMGTVSASLSRGHCTKPCDIRIRDNTLVEWNS